MNHISPYKLFESEEIINTLKDICLELEDEGYYVYFGEEYGLNIILIRPDKDSIGVSFDIEPIKDSINRILTYLDGKWKYIRYMDSSGNFNSFGCKIALLTNIYQLKITY